MHIFCKPYRFFSLEKLIQEASILGKFMIYVEFYLQIPTLLDLYLHLTIEYEVVW